MQDHSSVNTSNLARQCNASVVACLPSQPNPMAHVWAYMNRQLHERFPDLTAITWGPAVVEESLAGVLQQISKDIPQSLRYSSMPRR